MTKILLPHQPGHYAAFPTALVHDGQLLVFYRVAQASRSGIHGLAGSVRRIAFALPAFLDALDDPSVDNLYPLGEDRAVFCEHNEMDAIISAPQGLGFALATRWFDQQGMQTFMSFNPHQPEFTARAAVKVPGTQWLAFYGKGLAVGDDMVFTAYGALPGAQHAHPLLVKPESGDRWSLLAALPSNFLWEGAPVVLNECSLVRWQDQYHLFMRRDSFPFGIWHARSADLLTWTQPEPLLDMAHAPMALVFGDRLWLVFRHLIADDEAAIAVLEPFGATGLTQLERYSGSPYDGGYGDPVALADRVLVVYYCGNAEGEPFLKVCDLRDHLESLS